MIAAKTATVKQSMTTRSRRAPLLGLLLFLAAGCSSVHPLVGTPTLYSANHPYPATEIPASLQTPTANILYVTDRQQIPAKEGRIDYDAGRSRSTAFGTVTVQFGKDFDWTAIVEASQTQERKKKIRLLINSVTELGRFPETPLVFSMIADKPVVASDVEAHYEQASAELRAEIMSRLASSNSSELVLFIHGYNTPFDEAAFITSEIWHFAGRRGVPIIYSWPSGSGGLFGYFTDRESGEFTIFHLKEFLRLIETIPELKHINIVSHSRGTDVITTALRELVIESRAAGRNPRDDLRIENLIMAAPDLDFGVVEQRLVAEKFGPAIGRITIYTSDGDGALRISQMLMKGTRFGRIKSSDLSDADATIFANIKNVNFIDVERHHGFVGHSYYRKDPGVFSDIITLIRNSSAPGELSRPLEFLQRNFWRLPKDYLAEP